MGLGVTWKGAKSIPSKKRIWLMITDALLKTICRAGRTSILCAAFGFSSLCLPASAVAQPACSGSYTFATLTVKNFMDAAGTATHGKQFVAPKGLAVDGTGNIYVADNRNQTICRMTPTGDVTILAGRAGCIGSADGKGEDARFRYPQAVALDAAGNIYVADSGNNTIRRVTPSGVVTTLAGMARQVGSADGTGNAARFNYPNSVAVDSSGNIYVADVYNSTIRKVTSAGVVTTLAGQTGVFGKVDGTGKVAQFNAPVCVAVDDADDVYVADFLNNAIRKVTATGVVTTMAGQRIYRTGSADGTGRTAQFSHPCGLAVDKAGNVYVADTDNQTIRRITPDGVVSTLAGLTGHAGNADGTSDTARFACPISIALDSAGGLYVADLDDATIRKGVPANPRGVTLFTSATR
jgi:sugar lactone lactonase YvrE